MGIYRTRTDRIFADRSRVNDMVRCTREIVAMSKSILAQPVANTFLGRKSQEPFPREQDADRSISPKTGTVIPSELRRRVSPRDRLVQWPR